MQNGVVWTSNILRVDNALPLTPDSTPCPQPILNHSKTPALSLYFASFSQGCLASTALKDASQRAHS